MITSESRVCVIFFRSEFSTHVILEQIKGDGDPTCFSDVGDTGVPDLQGWCQALTVKSRQRGARAFRSHIRVFAMSVKSYIDSIGAVSEGDKEALREMWQTPRPRDLYTFGEDSDDDDDDDNDILRDFEWVYQNGRLVPKLREIQQRSSTSHGDTEGQGIVGRLSKV